MKVWNASQLVLAGAFTCAILAGCQNLPGTAKSQGAVVGGAAGAVVGEAVAGESLLGPLLGGAAGAAAGYLIGANWGAITNSEESQDEALAAVREAQEDPATVEDVYGADTADLNSDGFVTMDEVIAMENAGLTDAEMLDRLRETDQVFELSQEQEERLIAAGVSPAVLASMEEMNRA